MDGPSLQRNTKANSKESLAPGDNQTYSGNVPGKSRTFRGNGSTEVLEKEDRMRGKGGENRRWRGKREKRVPK
jgi:hypothetical protein